MGRTGSWEVGEGSREIALWGAVPLTGCRRYWGEAQGPMDALPVLSGTMAEKRLEKAPAAQSSRA